MVYFCTINSVEGVELLGGGTKGDDGGNGLGFDVLYGAHDLLLLSHLKLLIPCLVGDSQVQDTYGRYMLM